ncbi:MAG TPA: protoporphyrinogen oxidase [Verrucomicrobiales bacterium]|nr:protoporphyrinogen oxidase [Verrucomicrobiales bacterium]
MKPVAIIGGGITGLTTAYQFHKKKIPFHLYESGSRLGGVIETVERDGYLAECGPNTLLETSSEITRLIEGLNLTERRCYADPEMKNRFITRNGRPVSIPLSPIAFFTSSFFSVYTKWRLMIEPFLGRYSGDKEESLADFVKRRLGNEFLDYAINPLVGGVYAGNPEELSVKHGFPKLYALEQKYGSLIRGQINGTRERKRKGTVSKQDVKMMTFDKGLQVLIDAIANRIKEHTDNSTTISRLESDPDGWELFSSTTKESIPRKHSAVLLTAPAFTMAKMEIGTSGDTPLKELSEITYPPVSSVALGFRREDVGHSLNGFGVLNPEKENLNTLGTIFSSSLFPNRAPEGHVLLTSYMGGSRSPDLALKPENEKIDLLLNDLKKLLHVSGKPTFINIRDYEKAIPQYVIGYDRFKNRMDQVEKQQPGLFIAGNCRNGISLSDSIMSGYSSADRIEKSLNETNILKPTGV